MTLVENRFPNLNVPSPSCAVSVPCPPADSPRNPADKPWTKVQALLLKKDLSKADVEVIVAIEKEIYPIERNDAQLIIASLMIRGKENPVYLSYALLVTPLLGKYIREAFEKKIKSEQATHV